MIHEHDRVVLTANLSTLGLEAGDVGTVVHVYGDGRAYEVEFVSLSGEISIVATVEASQVRHVQKHEITHARQLARA